MFKSFLISMFAIFLFALGATGSWFYLNMDPQEESDETIPTSPVVADGPPTDPFPNLDSFRNVGALPAVVRGPELGPEDLHRLDLAAAAKQKQLEQLAERLREHKLRINVTDADTKAAQREVEGALGEVRNLMESAEKLLDELTIAMEDLQQQQEDAKLKIEELRALEEEVGAGARTSMKTFAEYMQSMPAENAAEVLIEMINDGKMDFAIQLLRNMEARSVSKILAAIEDSQLLAELASRYPEAPVLR